MEATTIATPATASKLSAAKGSKGVHFPGFTGIRFILAWLVLAFHIEIIKSEQNLPNLLHLPFFRDCGTEAVTCFFTLSGFLITYLLFEEKATTGTVAVKAFYLRRLLRLWPVYYTVILTGFLIWPYLWPFNLSERMGPDGIGPVGLQLALFLTMLPNVVYLLPHTNFFTPHTWSIGVEEQFYLVWPWLIRKTTRYGLALVIMIGCYIAIKAGSVLIRGQFELGSEAYYLWDRLYGFVSITRIDCMAIGALGAWWMRYGRVRAPWIGHRITSWVALFGLLGTLTLGWYIPYLQQELKAACFVLVLVGMALRPEKVQWLEMPWLRYLGNISYGFYMYHTLAVSFCIMLFTSQMSAQDWSYRTDILVYVTSTILTIGLSVTSYELMERRFIRLKGKFERVKSRG